MIIKNVKVFTQEQEFKSGSILIREGKITNIYFDTPECEVSSSEEIIDGSGGYAIPGLIDIHFHGCVGEDFCDGTKEAMKKIAVYEASVGVTAIAPATMTLPVEELEDILSVAAEYEGGDLEADFVGINMEGPFISPIKKGAQDPKNILKCDATICKRFLEASGDLVKFIGLAPEESENAIDFINEMKDSVNISLAHTNANYDSAKAAFDAGAKHAVHLYNAMSQFTHRDPGVVGAVADSEHVMAELICDGVHIHPSVIRATFKMLGYERIVLISDSMRATGMPDGRYTLGGFEVDVKENRAELVSDGALAGSVTNLMDCMRTAVKLVGIPLEQAVVCATTNPAKSIGICDTQGSLSVGKYGNVVILDEDLNTKYVIKKGKLIKA